MGSIPRACATTWYGRGRYQLPWQPSIAARASNGTGRSAMNPGYLGGGVAGAGAFFGGVRFDFGAFGSAAGAFGSAAA